MDELRSWIPPVYTPGWSTIVWLLSTRRELERTVIDA